MEISLNHDEIQDRAYYIWLSEGKPAGKEVEHWLRAERELCRNGECCSSKSTVVGKKAKSSETASASCCSATVDAAVEQCAVEKVAVTKSAAAKKAPEKLAAEKKAPAKKAAPKKTSSASKA